MTKDMLLIPIPDHGLSWKDRVDLGLECIKKTDHKALFIAASKGIVLYGLSQGSLKIKWPILIYSVAKDLQRKQHN